MMCAFFLDRCVGIICGRIRLDGGSVSRRLITKLVLRGKVAAQLWPMEFLRGETLKASGAGVPGLLFFKEAFAPGRLTYPPQSQL
jgi:hypothetical protein